MEVPDGATWARPASCLHRSWRRGTLVPMETSARSVAVRRLLLAAVIGACGGILITLGVVIFRGRREEAAPPAAPLTFEQQIDRAIEEGKKRLESCIALTAEDKAFLLRAARTVLENRGSGRSQPVRRDHWGKVPPNLCAPAPQRNPHPWPSYSIICNCKSR